MTVPELRRQRDELVEALQRLHDRAHQIAGEALINWRAQLQEACAEARAHIAKVERQL